MVTIWHVLEVARNRIGDVKNGVYSVALDVGFDFLEEGTEVSLDPELVGKTLGALVEATR